MVGKSVRGAGNVSDATHRNIVADFFYESFNKKNANINNQGKQKNVHQIEMLILSAVLILSFPAMDRFYASHNVTDILSTLNKTVHQLEDVY